MLRGKTPAVHPAFAGPPSLWLGPEVRNFPSSHARREPHDLSFSGFRGHDAGPVTRVCKGVMDPEMFEERPPTRLDNLAILW